MVRLCERARSDAERAESSRGKSKLGQTKKYRQRIGSVHAACREEDLEKLKQLYLPEKTSKASITQVDCEVNMGNLNSRQITRIAGTRLATQGSGTYYIFDFWLTATGMGGN